MTRAPAPALVLVLVLVPGTARHWPLLSLTT
jgi:hypothetical protein